MAVRVHVLRTCDRCSKPVETDGSVSVAQLKEGDIIPAFKGPTLRIVREEPALDGGESTTKVLGTFVDLCSSCENVIKTALATLLKVSVEATDDQEDSAEPKRKRAGRQPKSNPPDMPGPNGPLAATADPASSLPPSDPPAPSTPSAPPAPPVEPAASGGTVFSAEPVSTPF